MLPIESISVIRKTPTTILFKIGMPEDYKPRTPITFVGIFTHEQRQKVLKFQPGSINTFK